MSKKRKSRKEYHDYLWSKPIPTGMKHRPSLIFDYYQRPFALYHVQLQKEGYDWDKPHPIRKGFWGLLPYRTYYPLEARELILEYVRVVESAIADIVSKYSLAYWLHLYRRLFPSSVGSNKDPVTIGLIRATLEAAIQKYSQFEPCERVGITGEVSINQVLGGILMAPEFDLERRILIPNQLVLTDFTFNNLREFYDLERLAYELWRSTAMLRIVGKGSSIAVDDSETTVFDLRSDDLDKLVSNFDERTKKLDFSLLSAKGVVGNAKSVGKMSGQVFLPIYNLGKIPVTELDPLFAFFKLNLASFDPNAATNFVWLLFPLREYEQAHLSFADAFKEKHSIELDAVLLIIGAICTRVFYMWKEAKHSLWRFFQRGYEGPYPIRDIENEIYAFAPSTAKLLNLDENYASGLDVSKAMKFWTLNNSRRNDIDLAYAGPHSIFLPYNQERVFIDYAWILRRLYDLFLGVNIPDQNFKGEALERLIRFDKSALPIKQCQARDGTSRQIDAAFVIDNRLVIVECRAVGISTAFDRGKPDAIRFRESVVEKALNDIDEKANWLVQHPVGSNYDLTRYREILPIAVTPFAEYIPSVSSRYWLNDDLPRVLTPAELRTALEDGRLSNVTKNVISLNST